MSRYLAGYGAQSLPVTDISALRRALVAAGPMSDGDALAVALRLKALADPARAKIMSCSVQLAGRRAESAAQLAAALSLSDGTASPRPQPRKRRLRSPGMHVFHRYNSKPCKRKRQPELPRLIREP